MLKSKLLTINHIFQAAKTFEEAFTRSRDELLALFGAEQIRLYKRDPKKSEIFSVVPVNGVPREVRFPFSTDSVAGFTALTLVPIMLKALKPEDLSAVHPHLAYNVQYDTLAGFSARNMISMPVRCESSLMGVLQILNKKQGTFSREDEAFCRLIVNIMGQKLHTEGNIPKGPYDNLIFRGLLTKAQLLDARERATREGIPISVIMRTELKIDPEDIGKSLELYYQIPFVRYGDSPIPLKMLKGINQQFLVNNLWLPLQYSGDRVVVLVHDPHDVEKMDDIRRTLNAKSYEFRVGLAEEILAFLGDPRLLPRGENENLIAKAEREFVLPDLDAEDDDDVDEKEAPSPFASGDDFEREIAINEIDGEDIAQESAQQAVGFVNKMIVHAHTIGASDIHVEPSRAGVPGVVRMRVDGSCERVMPIPEDIIRPVISRIKIISNLDISEKRLPQDGKAKVRFRGKDLELRIATLPTVHGESVVLRMLAAGESLPFDKLNLTERNKTEIDRLIKRPHGIFLVVGPTGSGKTTTLHSILARINTPDKKIWTVEDPVEITQAGLQQVQVDTSIGLTFARIMRSFLRADPDVILVGEMRDTETAQIGVEASLTGHMVFSTLHTNSAPETITRLLEMDIEPINFSEALQGVLAQRLVKTLCPACRKAYTPSEEEWDFLVTQYGKEHFEELNVTRETTSLNKAEGCPKCGKTGYKGRTGIHELLVATPEIRSAIIRRKPVEEIATLAMEQGMRTLYQDGISKILKGDVDILQLQKVTAAE